MNPRKTFAVYRYETWSEKNPLRCFLWNANNKTSDGVNLVLKGRCGITSIPTFLIATEYIALGWSLASSCWRSISFSDLLQQMRLFRGFNFCRAFALLLELNFVHFTMSPVEWCLCISRRLGVRFPSAERGSFFLSERTWMTIFMAFHSQVLMIHSSLVTCKCAVQKIITLVPV